MDFQGICLQTSFTD